MRTKEIEKITHFYFRSTNLARETKNAANAFSYYGNLLKELKDKSNKLYHLFINENGNKKVHARIKKSSKDKTIRHILKLKRAVVLHAIESGNKSLEKASDYTYSDFSRPAEEIRLARIQQVLNAAKRIKHPERFGVSQETIKKTERLFEEYVNTIDKPGKRKKERSRQAKQCRKMLDEINFILRKKIAPFIENIKDEYPCEAISFKCFLKPAKVGRPQNKPRRNPKALKTAAAKQDMPNANPEKKHDMSIIKLL